MALSDFFTAIGDIASPLATIGGSVWDYLSAEDDADAFLAASGLSGMPGIVDPFGATNRSIYQGKLNALYNDPAYLENLPGFRFARDQGIKAVNREMSRSGMFLSPNRFEKLGRS
jgi:hypothetical protein